MILAAQHGIPMRDFDLMCGREMQNVMKGVQIDQRRSWEQTRVLAYFIINKDVKRSKQIPLCKVFTLPGEKVTKARLPSHQETAKLIHRWEKFTMKGKINGISES